MLTRGVPRCLQNATISSLRIHISAKEDSQAERIKSVRRKKLRIRRGKTIVKGGT